MAAGGERPPHTFSFLARSRVVERVHAEPTAVPGAQRRPKRPRLIPGFRGERESARLIGDRRGNPLLALPAAWGWSSSDKRSRPDLVSVLQR
jgi:hypothetical protein